MALQNNESGDFLKNVEILLMLADEEAERKLFPLRLEVR